MKRWLLCASNTEYAAIIERDIQLFTSPIIATNWQPNWNTEIKGKRLEHRNAMGLIIVEC